MIVLLDWIGKTNSEEFAVKTARRMASSAAGAPPRTSPPTLQQGARIVPPDPSVTVEEVLLCVGQEIGHENVLYASRMNKAVVVFMQEEKNVNDLIEKGVVIREIFTPVSPLALPSVRITLSGVPPFLTNTQLTDELQRFGKFASGVKMIPLGCRDPRLKHVQSLRRQVFMFLDAPSQTLEVSFRVKHGEGSYMIYASSGQLKCFDCGDIGHKRFACPHRDRAQPAGGENTQAARPASSTEAEVGRSAHTARSVSGAGEGVGGGVSDDQDHSVSGVDQDHGAAVRPARGVGQDHEAAARLASGGDQDQAATSANTDTSVSVGGAGGSFVHGDEPAPKLPCMSTVQHEPIHVSTVANTTGLFPNIIIANNRFPVQVTGNANTTVGTVPVNNNANTVEAVDQPRPVSEQAAPSGSAQGEGAQGSQATTEENMEEDESDEYDVSETPISASADLYTLKEINAFLDETKGKAIKVTDYFPDTEKFIRSATLLQKIVGFDELEEKKRFRLRKHVGNLRNLGKTNNKGKKGKRKANK